MNCNIYKRIISVLIALLFVVLPVDVYAEDNPTDALFMDNIEVYSTTLTPRYAYDYGASDLKIMTCIIYAEAGNQSQKGRVAVGNCIMNRVRDPRFPNNIHDVVYAKNQFTAVTGAHYKNALKQYSKINKTNTIVAKTMRKCKTAAKTAMGGTTYIGNYLFYARYDNWLGKKALNDPSVHTKRLGDHVFFDEYPKN
jgi:spore germination cell wall hydrolase CwlJ-like protein